MLLVKQAQMGNDRSEAYLSFPNKPLMTFSQAKLGAAWWPPKLVVVDFICLATP